MSRRRVAEILLYESEMSPDPHLRAHIVVLDGQVMILFDEYTSCIKMTAECAERLAVGLRKAAGELTKEGMQAD